MRLLLSAKDENKAYQMQLQFLEHVPLMKRLPKAYCTLYGDRMWIYIYI